MRGQAADTGGPLVQRARVPSFPRRQITVFGEKIGVSVTRAFKWPAGEMAYEDADRLLRKKLYGIHSSSRNVRNMRWRKQAAPPRPEHASRRSPARTAHNTPARFVAEGRSPCHDSPRPAWQVLHVWARSYRDSVMFEKVYDALPEERRLVESAVCPV